MIASAFFFILGALYSGGGHSITPMIIFFPFPMLLDLTLPPTRFDWLFYPLCILQFSVYAGVLLFSWKKNLLVSISFLLLVHTLAAGLCLKMNNYRNAPPPETGVTRNAPKR
jgi:hypothetical protein